MPRVNALPPPITGDTYRITIFSRSQGQVCMNTFDYMGATYAASPNAPMAVLLAAFVTAIQTPWLACVTAQTRIFTYNIQCLSSNAPVSLNTVVSVAGSVAGDPLPLEMGAIVKKTGPLKGQHGRGRIYMPGIPTSFTTPATEPNLLNAAGIAAYTALGTAMAGNLTSGAISYEPVVAPRPVPPAFVVTLAAAITSCVPVTLLGTVRRRREGRGI